MRLHKESTSTHGDMKNGWTYKGWIRGFVLAIAMVPVLGASPAAPAPAGPALLIYAGWYGNTIPTPSFVSANKTFLESQPFDGLVMYLRDPGMTFNVTTKTMTTTAVSYDTAMSILSPVKNLSFTHLTHNLGLIQGSTPPDFFDDWSVTIQNFANVAKAAKDSGLKGLCFDNEQYFAPWGDYSGSTKYAATKTLANYQVQARLRGKQVMEAMVAQFPDIAVITLHGPSVSEPKAPASLEFPQWQSGNELLGPFFAGFMEGVNDTAANIDGGELYTLRTEAQFEASYTWNRNTIASDTVNCAFIPPALRTVWPAKSSISFGVYDMPFAGADMNSTILRSTLANALRRADRYVWYYAEASTYLLPAGSGGASAAWVDAIRQARTDAGSASTTPTPSTPTDPALPAAPTNLAGQAATSTSVSLNWTDASSNENGFSIERMSGSTWSQVSWVGANITTYTDSGLSTGVSYSYRVLAFNSAGNSAASNSITVSLAAPGQIPAAPTGLAVVSTTSSSVNLKWTDGSSNENGFSIERLGGSTWSQVGWVADNVTTYADVGLIAGTSYSYRVLAFNGYGNSAVTNVVTATPSAATVTSTAPTAPENLVAVPVATTEAELTWIDTSSNETGFKIYRKKANGGWRHVATLAPNSSKYRDCNLTPGSSYTLRMCAVNSSGSSAWSKEAKVTMPK